MYIKRTVEKQVLTLSEKFTVVLVTGAIQVGKSTMLNHIKEPNRKYVSLDDLVARSLAIDGEKLFLETYNINSNFKIRYQRNEIIISLNLKNLKKHYIFDFVKLINKIKNQLNKNE